MSEIGVDEQLTRKVRKIAMTSKFELSEQPQSRTTRRMVVATGAKLAYAVPIVAASLKVSAISAFAATVTGRAVRPQPRSAGVRRLQARLHLSGSHGESV